MDDRQFGVTDIDRWAEEGLISRKQAQSILRAEGLAESGSISTNAQAGSGLNVITLFSYFGAFLALTGFGLFISINWGDFTDAEQIALLLPVTVGLLAVGYYLRSGAEYRLGGNLLFLVGTALVPITVFAIGSALGSGEGEDFFDNDDIPGATVLVAVSLLLTTVLVFVTRVPQASLVPAGLLVALAAVTAAWVFAPEDENEIWSATLSASAVVIGLSVALSMMSKREYGLWTSLAGHATFFLAATALFCFVHWTPASGAAYLAIYVGILLLSIPLQNRVFLVAGVAGVYTFVFRLTAEEASGPALPLAFAAIGVSLIVVAMLYQRARQQWSIGLP